MALRPFVIKHAFYLPDQRGFGKGNHGALAHLDYMGDPNRHHKSDEELLMGDPSIHAKYMSERPGTAGYFGPDPRTLPDIDAIQSTLQSHTGPIWRDFVSVTEKDALTLGGHLLTREGWERAARHQLPKMFAQMGLDPANVDWVASVHKKEGHPHMHLLYWEREPHRIKGQWSEKERLRIRKGWVQELYGSERDRLGQEKSALRQQILSGVKGQDIGLVSPQVQKEWQLRLSRLADHVPGHGRAALQYMPPSVKAEAQGMADWLLTHVLAFRAMAQRYGDIAAEMAQHYSGDPGQHQKARQNAQTDLTDRVSQIILQQAAALDNNIRWDFVRDTLQTDDPHVERELHRISRLIGEEREQAIHDYATQLRGDRSEKYQRPLERGIAQSLRYIEEVHRQQAAHGLRGVFFGLQSVLRQAESENRREAAKRRWEAAKDAWIQEARAKGVSEENIARIEMG